MNRLRAWCRSTLAKPNHSSRHRQFLGHMLHVERLEPRELLATFAVDGVQFTTIQNAIDAAAANPGDDIIAISPGNYDENPHINDLSGGLVLRGISGIAADVIIDGGGRDDVVTASVPAAVTFESLTISGGGNSQDANDASAGRGLRFSGAGDLLLISVVIANNRSGGLIGENAMPGGTVRVQGGDFSGNRNGIFLQRFTTVEIDGVTANDNSLGGLYTDNSGDITIVGSEFSRNRDNGIDLRSVANVTLRDLTAQGNGTGVISGLFLSTSASLSIQDSLFTGSAGPGIVAIGVAGQTKIVNVICEANTGRAAFIENSATGGPVSIAGGSFSDNAGGGLGLMNVGEVMIASSRVVGNGAVVNSPGGGIRIEASSPAAVTISGAEVLDNASGTHGGGIYINRPGSGLAPAVIRDSTIAGNQAGTGQGNGEGGGIFLANATSQAIVERSTIRNNQSKGQSGGGVKSFGSLVLVDSTIAGNSAAMRGGGVEIVNNHLTIVGSTLSGNRADAGGGFWASGVISILNSTLSGNSAASEGGGLYAELANLSLAHSTVASNISPVGGGLSVLNVRASSVDHNIIAGNTINASTGEVRGSVTSLGYNLVGAAGPNSGFHHPTDLTGAIGQPLDARLAPLADNGGPTQTHALLSGSQAADGGDPAGNLVVDQRGLPRPVDGNGDGIARIDIGAFEAQSIVQHFPTATDDSHPTSEDEALHVAAPGVLANDSDPDNLPLAAELISPPSHGSLGFQPDGSFVYTPEANFHGVDSFRYRAVSGLFFSPPARVTLTITPVNDVPSAVDAVFSLPENSATGTVLGAVSASDIDGDALAFSFGDRDAAAFAIDEQTGEISVADAALLDFEVQGRFDLLVEVIDASGGRATAQARVELTDVLEIAIDISPHDRWNRIRLDSKEIEVAILGTENFDPLAQLDLGTLRLRAPGAASGASVPFHHRRGYEYQLRDVNRDGILDLVLRFRTKDTDLQEGDSSLRLEGSLNPEHGGEYFAVAQNVAIVSKRT